MWALSPPPPHFHILPGGAGYSTPVSEMATYNAQTETANFNITVRIRKLDRKLLFSNYIQGLLLYQHFSIDLFLKHGVYPDLNLIGSPCTLSTTYLLSFRVFFSQKKRF